MFSTDQNNLQKQWGSFSSVFFFCVDLNVLLTDRVVCDSPSLPGATQQIHYVLDFSYQLFLFTNYMFLQVGCCLQACQVSVASLSLQLMVTQPPQPPTRPPRPLFYLLCVLCWDIPLPSLVRAHLMDNTAEFSIFLQFLSSYKTKLRQQCDM